MARKKMANPPAPSPFVREFDITVNGRIVESGTEVTISGHGRMRFVCLVRNTVTGSTWVDCSDKNRQVRSFHVDEIKRVHYKKKLGR
jgi:hypothetical protein